MERHQFFLHREVVSAILEGDNWEEALRNVFKDADGSLQTPIRILIKDFPDLVSHDQCDHMAILFLSIRPSTTTKTFPIVKHLCHSKIKILPKIVPKW